MRLSFMQKFPWKPATPTYFVEKITLKSGYCPKLHTIRRDPKRRWKAGRKIDCTTGSRFKPVVFHSCTCVSTQNIAIIIEDSIQVIIDNRKLKPMEVVRLVLNDGFDSVEDFFRYFHTTQTDLVLIHFTDLKY